MATAKNVAGGLKLPGDEAVVEAAVETGAEPVAETPSLPDDADLAARYDKLETEYLTQSDKLASANAELASLRDRVRQLEEAADAAAAAAGNQAEVKDSLDAAEVDGRIAREAAAAAKAAKAAEKEAAAAAKKRAAKIDGMRALHDKLFGDEGAAADAGDLAAFLNGDLPAGLLLSDGATFDVDFHPDIHPRDVTPFDGNAITLNAQLDLPPTGDPLALSAAVLVLSNRTYARCAVGPVAAGGGQSVRLPAGSLLFRFAATE